MRLYLVFGSLLVAAALVLLVQSAPPVSKKKKTASKTPAAANIAELLAAAESKAQEQEYTEAHKLVRRARDLDSHRPESYLVGGKIYWLANVPQGAEEEWKRGLERAGEDPGILLHLALLELQAKRNPDAALALLQRAKDVSPEFPALNATMAEALAIQAEGFLQAGDLARAKTKAQEALALNANSVAAHVVFARIAEKEDRWPDALKSWEFIFSSSPEPTFRVSLAEAHKRVGYQKLATRRDEAIVHFRRTVDLAAEGVDVNFLLDVLQQESNTAFEEGKKAYEAKDFGKAKERFAYASSLVPDNYLADNHLGLARLKDGDRDGAVEAWESAIAKAEKTGGRIMEAPTHKNLSLLYKEMGKFKEADRVGKAYLEKYPEGPYAKEIRGLVSQ